MAPNVVFGGNWGEPKSIKLPSIGAMSEAEIEEREEEEAPPRAPTAPTAPRAPVFEGRYGRALPGPSKTLHGRMAESWEHGWDTVHRGTMGAQILYGNDNPQLRESIGRVKTRQEAQRYRPKAGIPERILTGFMEVAPVPLEMARFGAERAGVMGLGVGAMAAPSGVPAAPLAAGAAKVGFVSGSMQKIFEIEGGNAYLDMEEMGIHPDVARPVAIGVGSLNAAIELPVLGWLVAMVPGGKQALRKLFNVGSKAAAKKLADTMGKRLAKRAGMAGAGYAGEIGQEVLQETVNIAGEEIAAEISNALKGTDVKAPSKKEIKDRLIETAKTSATDFALMVGMPAIAGTAGDIRAQRRADREMDKSERTGKAPDRAVIMKSLKAMHESGQVSRKDMEDRLGALPEDHPMRPVLMDYLEELTRAVPTDKPADVLTETKTAIPPAPKEEAPPKAKPQIVREQMPQEAIDWLSGLMRPAGTEIARGGIEAEPVGIPMREAYPPLANKDAEESAQVMDTLLRRQGLAGWADEAIAESKLAAADQAMREEEEDLRQSEEGAQALREQLQGEEEDSHIRGLGGIASYIHQARELVMMGEPGRRAWIEKAPGEGGGRDVIGWGSTYPDFMRDKYDLKTMLAAIDKGLRGEEFADRASVQAQAWDDVVEYSHQWMLDEMKQYGELVEKEPHQIEWLHSDDYNLLLQELQADGYSTQAIEDAAAQYRRPIQSRAISGIAEETGIPEQDLADLIQDPDNPVDLQGVWNEAVTGEDLEPIEIYRLTPAEYVGTIDTADPEALDIHAEKINEHRAAVQDAVARRIPVRPDVLWQYHREGNEWATVALATFESGVDALRKEEADAGRIREDAGQVLPGEGPGMGAIPPAGQYVEGDEGEVIRQRAGEGRPDLELEEPAEPGRPGEGLEARYPLAGDQVDGRTVLEDVPNTDSIAASMDDYETLPGIREVPLSDFDSAPEDMFVAADDRKTVRDLAKEIEASGEISPLIVAVDEDGPYILEGAHRLGALHELGATAFPAMVVRDTTAPSGEIAPAETPAPVAPEAAEAPGGEKKPQTREELIEALKKAQAAEEEKAKAEKKPSRYKAEADRIAARINEMAPGHQLEFDEYDEENNWFQWTPKDRASPAWGATFNTDTMDVDEVMAALMEKVTLFADAAKQVADAAKEVDTAPTEAQKKAGNYKKGHLVLHPNTPNALEITIESPKGSTRSGVDESGNAWKQKMAHHYGYVRRTEGADGDQVDVFIGPSLDSFTVFVVNQVDSKGNFDEHKVMIGFKTEEAARKGYLANYEKGLDLIGSIHSMAWDNFKEWLRTGDTTKPYLAPWNPIEGQPKAHHIAEGDSRGQPGNMLLVTKDDEIYEARVPMHAMLPDAFPELQEIIDEDMVKAVGIVTKNGLPLWDRAPGDLEARLTATEEAKAAARAQKEKERPKPVDARPEKARVAELYKEYQAMLKRLPGDIGKAKREGRFTKAQQKNLDRINEIEAMPEFEGPEWKAAAKAREETYQKDLEKWRAEQRELGKTELEKYGLEERDKVYRVTRSLLGFATQRLEGIVKVDKNGSPYVYSKAQKGKLSLEGWKKIEEAAPEARGQALPKYSMAKERGDSVYKGWYRGTVTEGPHEGVMVWGRDRLEVEKGLRHNIAQREEAQFKEGRTPYQMVSDWAFENLRIGKSLTWQNLFKRADKAFAGTQAEGKYTPKDAYDALEAGVNRYIREEMRIPSHRQNRDVQTMRDLLRNLKTEILAKIPTQSKRTYETDELQQFSTPPPLAALVAWAAQIQPTDVVLEPSAGTGSLAVMAEAAGAAREKIFVNELSQRRREIIRTLGYENVTGVDAEQIYTHFGHNGLPGAVFPTVVVMNPPFSAAGRRMPGVRNTKIGAKHVEQALKLLAPRGRLVAIMGKGMQIGKPTFAKWWADIGKKYDVKAVVRLSGKEYAKYGTTFDNVLIIIDKNPPSGEDILTADGKTFENIEGAADYLGGRANERVLARKPVAAKPRREEAAEPGEREPGPEPTLRPPTGAVGGGRRPTGRPPVGPRGEPGPVPSGEPGPGVGVPPSERGPRPGERRPDKRRGERPGAPGQPPRGAEAGVPPREGPPGELSLEDASPDDLLDIFDQETKPPTEEKPPAPPPGPPTKLPERGYVSRENRSADGKLLMVEITFPGNYYDSKAVTNAKAKYKRRTWNFEREERKGRRSVLHFRKGVAAAPKMPAARKKAAETKAHVKKIGEGVKAINKILGERGEISWRDIDKEDTVWQQIRPILWEMWQEAKAAKRSAQEFIQLVVGAGLDAAARPYVEKFVREEIGKRPVAPAPLEYLVAEREARGELTDDLYDTYTPEQIDIPGAKPHPGKLVQSAAMSAVTAPAPKYRPVLSKETVSEGRLSLIQLEAIIYAGEAHSQTLPDGRRRGFFIGDGTGVGKGREAAGIFWDNWNQGRKKAVWVSEKRPLFSSAQRDIEGAGWDPNVLIEHGKVKATAKIKAEEGILFTSYDTAAAAPQLTRMRKKWRAEYGKLLADRKLPEGVTTIEEYVQHQERAVRSRREQIQEWLGPDFDGVIVFDESHNMGNAVSVRGARGRTQPAQKAIACVELQNALPNARIVYASATGATEVINLAYCERLGLWGEGTPFPNKQNFVNEIARGGVAAMELVAQNIKADGSYMARSLSYDGVTQDKLTHELTPQQIKIYDKMADAWQIVMRNVNAALEATGVITTDPDTGAVHTNNGNAKGAALSALFGSNQRFFNQVITAMQLPTVMRSIKSDIAQGHAVVIQLTNTMEAQQERALASMTDEDNLEDLDLTPRDTLMDFIENSFPTTQFEEYTDDDGNVRTRPVVIDGVTQENPDAVRMKEQLLDELSDLKVPDAPLNSIINEFGHDNVAEVTGRGRRVIRKVNDEGVPEMVEEKWSRAKGQADIKLFMNDQKRILIFSEAGGTGASYDADRSVKNQRRRMHYLLQPGWRADKAVQGLGRTHRANQAIAPHYWLAQTNLKGQMRFVSSVARRLDQMGALTKGMRQTGSGGIFSARDNLESDYAQDAFLQFIDGVYDGNLNEVLTLAEFEEMLGLKITDPQGNLLRTLPEVKKFLNRILNLQFEKQNAVFNAFDDLIGQVISRHMEAGTLDMGVETLKGDVVSKTHEETVYISPRSGAETKYIRLDVTLPAQRVSWEHVGRSPYQRIYRNIKSGQVWAAKPHRYTDNDTGAVIDGWAFVSPAGGYQIIDPDTLRTADKWEHLRSPFEAKRAWNDRLQELPPTVTRQEHIIAGTLLPIWDRLHGHPRIMRVQTTDTNEQWIGRRIPPTAIGRVLRNLGAEGARIEITPEQIHSNVLNDNWKISLANDWRIERRTVSGEARIELVGPELSDFTILGNYGVFRERIGYKMRFFIPTTPAGVQAIERMVTHTPVVSAIPPPALSIRREAPRSKGLDEAAGQMLPATNSRTLVKDPDFQAAKRGEVEPAIRTVERHVKPKALEIAKRKWGSDVVYVPVQALEHTGPNTTPRALAEYYAAKVGGEVNTDVVQANQVFHTGAKMLSRMLARAVFDGPIAAGKNHVIVDDVITSGGTIAELANYIQSKGGKVVGVIPLANASRSATIGAKPDLVQRVKEKFDEETLTQFLGINPEALTTPELYFILKHKDAISLRNKITQARIERGGAGLQEAIPARPALQLARRGAEAPAPYTLTRSQKQNLGRLANLVKTWLKSMNPDPEVLARINVDLQPIIDISKHVPAEEVEEYVRLGATPERIMGMTTWDSLNATITLALNHQSLADLERTTYHEYFEIALKWLFPKADIDTLTRLFDGDIQEAADTFADFMYRRQRAITDRPKGVGRIFRRLRALLQRLANMLKGKGFARPEDIFGPLAVGAYKARGAPVSRKPVLKTREGGVPDYTREVTRGVPVITEAQRREYSRRYGIPSAVDVGSGPFGAGTGSLFIDDETGESVGYIPPPKIIDRRRPAFRLRKGDNREELRANAEQYLKDFFDKVDKGEAPVDAIPNKIDDVVPEEVNPEVHPSVFDMFKDDWLGNKDYETLVHSIETWIIQDALKGALGEKRFNKRCREYDEALHVWMDLKANPGHLEEYYNALTPDQKAVVDRAREIDHMPKLQKIAEYIERQYERTGLQALGENIIHNVLENYVARAWRIPEKKRGGVSADTLAKFKVTSRHARQRVFETIIQGWATFNEANVNAELVVKGASNNLQLLKDELSRVREDKRLVDKMISTEWMGTGKMMASWIQHPGYEPINHPNFTYWHPYIGVKGDLETETKAYGPEFRTMRKFGALKAGNTRASRLFDDERAAEIYITFMQRKYAEAGKPVPNYSIVTRDQVYKRAQLYAPADIAKRLNKMVGVSKIRDIPGVATLTKYNAFFKSTILITNLFHHFAFMRSLILPGEKMKLREYNPIAAWREGREAIRRFDPTIQLLVRNGLTLGRVQDWEEHILQTQQTIFGQAIDKASDSLGVKFPKEFRDWIENVRQMATDFLFRNFGAGLKAKAALIAYRANLERHAHEMSHEEIAKMTAELINDDFGGLHLQRKERDPTIQHFFRLAALAPDWTESNVATMYKGFLGGTQSKRRMYRRFWAHALSRGIGATFLANIAMAALGTYTEDDDQGMWERLLDHYKQAWKAGFFRWLDIDVTPLYKLFGGKAAKRKYVSILGHFKDPLKFLTKWGPSAKHKGSVLVKTLLEFFEGTDWKGARFTTWRELLGIDYEKGYYLTDTGEHKVGDPKWGKLRGQTVTFRAGRRGAVSKETIASFIFHIAKSYTPIQVQGMLDRFFGEMDSWDMFTKGLGIHGSSTYPTERRIINQYVDEWIDIKKSGGDFKAFRAKVAKHNEQQITLGEQGLPVSYSTIAQKGANRYKAERRYKRRYQPAINQ